MPPAQFPAQRQSVFSRKIVFLILLNFLVQRFFYPKRHSGLDPESLSRFVGRVEVAAQHAVVEPDAAEVLEAMPLDRLRPFGIAETARTFAGADDETLLAALLERDALLQAAVAAADKDRIEGHDCFV